MLASVYGASVAQVGVMINTFLASFLPVGSLSWLYYADRLYNLPLGLFGVALASVVLPYLSRCVVRGSEEAFGEGVMGGSIGLLLIGLPAAVGLWVLSEPIVMTLFHYGHFTAVDAHQTRLSAAGFCCRPSSIYVG